MAIRTFKTKNFIIAITAEVDDDLDYSWDETGEVEAKVASGKWLSFAARASVWFRGVRIGEDWLFGCIYEREQDLDRGYQRDLVREAIREARAFLESAAAV